MIHVFDMGSRWYPAASTAGHVWVEGNSLGSLGSLGSPPPPQNQSRCFCSRPSSSTSSHPCSAVTQCPVCSIFQKLDDLLFTKTPSAILASAFDTSCGSSGDIQQFLFDFSPLWSHRWLKVGRVKPMVERARVPKCNFQKKKEKGWRRPGCAPPPYPPFSGSPDVLTLLPTSGALLPQLPLSS